MKNDGLSVFYSDNRPQPITLKYGGVK